LQERYKNEIEMLASVSRRLGELGYVSSHGGNLSWRVAEDAVLITATKIPKIQVRFEDVCIVDTRGDTLYASAGRKPTGELPIHLRVYRKRADAVSIIHSHAPILTGFAIARSRLLEKAILPEPALELGPILNIPYAEPLTERLAMEIDGVIDKTNAFLMENYGVMVFSAEGVERTLGLMEMAEHMAESVLVAERLGGSFTLGETDIGDLDNVRNARKLPLPGKPGRFRSYVDVYGAEQN
jgi:L-fuculose-phosphate aldolase